jgi:hypothetical protein
MNKRTIVFLIGFIFILSACSPFAQATSSSAASSAANQPETAAETPVSVITPESNPTGQTIPTKQTAAQPSTVPLPRTPESTQTQSSPSADQLTLETTSPSAPTLGPDGWKELPIIPNISQKVTQIYQRGQELGNNPNSFSKIGDCGSTPSWFLGDFDRGPRYYNLGDHQNLNDVILAFQGSFSRTSLAAKSGFNASSIFSTLWSDHKQCQKNETPLACEFRLNRPSIAIITLGANDVFHPDEFEPQMRKIIEYSIEKGVIPVLATKPDNMEGDNSINATIARLAIEYDIPVWNYWRALQSLPDQGLQPDQVHITWGPNHFEDPTNMTRGWPVRNLTALQTLDAIWQALKQP